MNESKDRVNGREVNFGVDERDAYSTEVLCGKAWFLWVFVVL